MPWEWVVSYTSILTCIESQMPHFESSWMWIWQSIRNNLIAEWERPSVSESDLIHTNFGKFSPVLPSFRAKASANFLRLLPVELETKCLGSIKQLNCNDGWPLFSSKFVSEVKTHTFEVESYS